MWMPALTGTVAHASLTVPGPTDRRIHGISGLALGDQSFGVSGSFENLIHGADGGTSSLIGVSFETGNAFGINLELLVLRDDSSGDQALLRIFEFDGLGAFDVLSQLVLPSVAVAAIRNGDEYVLDLFIDRDNDLAFGSVRIEGIGNLELSPAAFTGLASESLEQVGQSLFIDDLLTPFSADVDMTSLSIYDDLRPLVIAFYVDVGAAMGTPSDTYGGVVPIGGTWNTVGLGSSPLTQVTGAPSSATATLTADFDDGSGTGAPADALALMGDHAGNCNTLNWDLAFDGLDDGYYRVYVYAPSASDTSSGVISNAQGGDLAEMTGAVGAALLPGVSFGQTEAVVSGGSLDLHGLGSGASDCAGIAGVQLLIRLDPPPPALPAFGVPAVLSLVGLLLGLGIQALRRRGPAQALA